MRRRVYREGPYLRVAPGRLRLRWIVVRIACGLLLPLAIAGGSSAGAQSLTTSDSAQIIALAVGELRKEYPLLATGVVVVDSLKGGFGPFANRLVGVLRMGDTVLLVAPARTTPRVSVGELIVAGDTVSIAVSVRVCRDGTGVGSYYGNNSVHRYMRVGSTWEAVPRRLVEHGDGSQCPW